MATKTSSPKPRKEKKIYTDVELENFIKEIPTELEKWLKNQDQKQKIASIYNTVMRWNQKGQGIKSILKNKLSAIGDVYKSYRKQPNDFLLEYIKTQKKEYIEMGGNANDLTDKKIFI